jgi:hypothetical protein
LAVVATGASLLHRGEKEYEMIIIKMRTTSTVLKEDGRNK